MTAWIIASNDLQKFHSFRPEKNEFTIRRASYLPVEGIGVNGTFFIRGWVAVRGNNLFVSASGYSAPMELAANSGAFNFYGNVTLLRDGETLIKRSLEMGANELWADDEYSPIGSASFMIPPSHDPSAYSVRIEASYTFSSSSGSAVPMPQFARTVIQLMGVER
ncbi:hypothetical protein ACJO2E_14615 [Marinobacter sp. M1N3S26]|uniref:hypothetical protein n=1 Tax=unclassified Marinobacter TaxID=83889 RepID=UPI00387B56AC